MAGQQRMPTTSGVINKSTGKGSDYPPQHLLAHIWNAASSLGPPNTGNTLTNWSEFSGGTAKMVRGLTGEISP